MGFWRFKKNIWEFKKLPKKYVLTIKFNFKTSKFMNISNSFTILKNWDFGYLYKNIWEYKKSIKNH